MRKRRARRSWLWAAVPFAVLLLAGCNGGDNGDGTDTADTTATTEPSTTEPPAETVFTRREIHTLSAEEISRYKAGVALMQSRAATSPTSWLYQANMHDFPEDDGTCPATPFSGPDPPEAWGTCQHASFFFLAWHRMYVYYFERVLRAAVREASGDPTADFALPYWDYENPANRDLPEPFRSPADASNSLFVSARASNCNNVVAGNPCISDAEASDDDAMDPQHTDFCGCRTATCAAGCVANRRSDETFGGNFTAQPVHFGSGTGELEFQPHNAVHVAVGAGGWMSDPACAARDPIFWLHHANIDRLWQVWLNQGGGRANTTNNEWRTQTFTFFDETGTAQTLTGCQVLNMATQLDYQYEGLPVNNVVLCDEGGPLTGEAGGPPPAAPKTLVAGAAAETRLGVRRTSVKVALPQAASQRILTLSGPDPGRVRLVLEGVKLLRHGSHYEVYLNLPAGATPDPKSPNYVGTVALFDHPAHAAETTRSFDVTDEVAALRAAGQWTGELDVSFVPGHGEQALTATAGSGPFVSVRKVSIEER